MTGPHSKPPVDAGVGEVMGGAGGSDTVLPPLLCRQTWWDGLGWAAPPREAPTLRRGSEFWAALPREGGGGGTQSIGPTDGFYLQPLSPVCARLLTYFEEPRAPLAQRWPPTRTP